MQNNCLTGLVGLTEQQCACLPPPPPGVDITTSKSGLYVDELLSQCLMLKYQDCTDKDIWEKIIKALARAIKDVTNDLTVALSTKFESKFKPFASWIGQTSNTGPSTSVTPGQTLGFSLHTEAVTGAEIVIEGIGLMLNVNTDNVEITVLKDGEFLENFLIDVKSTRARVWPILGEDGEPDPLILPADGSVYTIQYTLPAGTVPLQNNLGCGCSSEFALLDLLTKEQQKTYRTTSGFGLVLQARTRCSYAAVICAMLNDQASMLMIAGAIQYNAANKVLHGIYKDGSINVYKLTEISPERFLGYGSTFRSQYSSLIEKIAENADASQVHGRACFSCVPKAGFKVKNIRLA